MSNVGSLMFHSAVAAVLVSGGLLVGCVNNDAPEEMGSSGTATGGSSVVPMGGTSAGGTGSGTAGTATAGSGGGAAKPHTCAMTAKASGTSPVITDFEGMATPTSGYMFESAGITGGTYVYTDPLDTTSTSKLLFAAGHDAASTQALDGQIHNATWGGGMGLWFGCMDASVYTGITFWARGTSPAGKVKVNLTIDEAVKVVDGGVCPDAGPCVRPFVDIDVTDEWQEFTFAWADFMPGDAAGTALPGDTVAAINGLDFGLPNDNMARDLELLVDDFSFTK
jgi:hypothetical protein